MPLCAGAKLGPYEIVAPLGAGGMGEVYKALDTRLGREVAIKTAKAEFSGRFQREARAVAALNHVNISTLHDVGPNYLVMELVQGETLASLLRKGGLPMDTVLRYGTQIADALAAAHSKGITHRDLKPANIMVTKAGIKVLDFGLAKIEENADHDPDAGVTDAMTVTESRVIMGTPAYMAPEQLQGLRCDARTDIFALGLVLYEMTTGKRAFQGNNLAAVNAAVLQAEPAPLEHVSPSFAHLVERCLAKDADYRWQSAADIKLQLEFLSRGVAATVASAEPKRLLWPLATAVAVIAAFAAGSLHFSGNSQTEATITPVTSYPGSEVTPSFSPDGTQVAFSWNGQNEDNFDIYVKQIGVGEPIRLTKDPATDLMPKWSPDGKWIAFLRFQGPQTAAVYAVPALGGLERKLADSVVVYNEAGYWGNWFENLDWSPDGTWLMISKQPSPEQPPGLALLSFETGEIRPLLPPLPLPSYASATFAPDGHALAYWKQPGGLTIQPLSAAFEPKGAARDISLGAKKPTYIPSLSWSADSRDVLFSVGTRENSSVWRVPASGASSPRPVPFLGDGAAGQAVSRRGDRLVFSRYDKKFEIWSLNLDESGNAAGSAVKAFNSTKTDMNPNFSPDGTKVAFASNRSGNDEIWVCLSDGSNCSQLTNYAGPQVGTPRWSPDGNWIAFDLFQSGSSVQIIGSGGGKPRRLSNGLAPRWSKDGLWIYSWCLPEVGTCRTPAAGGKTEKVLDVTSIVEISPDGAWLCYSPNGPRPALRRMPIAGGASQEVLSPLMGGQAFAVSNSGIWYMTPNTREGSLLQYYDLASKSTRTVYRASRPFYSGLAISPDQRRILFSQIERPQNHDLVLVEPYK